MKEEAIRMEEITVSSMIQKTGASTFIGDRLLLLDDLRQVPWPTSPRRMKCLLMGLCLKGSAHYSVNTEEHNVYPGDVIIINEAMVVDDCRFSDDVNGLAIMMSYDFFSEIVKGIHELSQLFLFSRTHPVFRLTREEAIGIRLYCRAIKRLMCHTTHHFRTAVVRSLMTTMIYDISNAIYRLQQSSDQQLTRAEAIFSDFIRLVEANFRSQRRVSWYAKQLCITPKYLSESVKMASHRTPNDWIDNYVTMELRVLLKNSTLSIKEIALYLNFPNQSFLGKYFKEHVGMSPTDYRRSLS